MLPIRFYDQIRRIFRLSGTLRTGNIVIFELVHALPCVDRVAIQRGRTVYMYLRDRAGGGSCWPGVKTIAHDLHLSPRTVQRALNDLERAGYIQRQRRHRENGSCTSNLYIINMDSGK